MALFTRPVKCYMVAMSTKLAYTMDQLINKAYTAILQTGLYETQCMEYKGMEPENQTYATLKEHMEQMEVATPSNKETWRQYGHQYRRYTAHR